MATDPTGLVLLAAGDASAVWYDPGDGTALITAVGGSVRVPAGLVAAAGAAIESRLRAAAAGLVDGSGGPRRNNDR